MQSISYDDLFRYRIKRILMICSNYDAFILKEDGQIVTNTQMIDPMPVITGAAEYPQDLEAKLKASGARVDALDCLKLAEEAGSSKAVNIVLLGRLSHYFDLPEDAWMASLEANVPPKFLAMNKKAFALGRDY